MLAAAITSANIAKKTTIAIIARYIPTISPTTAAAAARPYPNIADMDIATGGIAIDTSAMIAHAAPTVAPMAMIFSFSTFNFFNFQLSEILRASRTGSSREISRVPRRLI